MTCDCFPLRFVSALQMLFQSDDDDRVYDEDADDDDDES